MYFLTYKEAYAWAHHGEEKAEICRHGQRRFLESHLGRWAPLFFKLLQAGAGGFYGRLGSLAREVLALEAQQLGVSPMELGQEAMPRASALGALENLPAPCEDPL